MTQFNFVDDEMVGVAQRARAVIGEFAQALKANQGRWAEYPRPLGPRTVYSFASNIMRDAPNTPKALRGGGFQATVSKGVLYVRYVGTEAVTE